ncbi:MAG: type VII secretion protein EccCa [Rhodococcus sp. (in: high G+C Gram-positive bacteria)]|uniref:type VII secretion protein EccCa n=1 Tax=Rhodococcus sp. TaxID=1831 RepID=UPI00121023BD|nr:type VII secretion protein EccCa [Rhodococcus sp. (in: high G+C Gram-positive bacteria)]RZL22568.1 MAG: type VII secretion protein EccCa [Rhodococcus sp. (in: high G+C Gram-positive bacteria)]
MSTVRFLRRARREAPRAPGGEVTLQAPPEIPRATPGNLLTKLLPVVMVVAMIGMVALMFTSGMARNPMSLLFPIMMMVSMLGMLAGGGRSGGARTAEVNEDRKDYLRYLDQLRRDVDETGQAQRRALEWSSPQPSLLWTLAGTSRMWERQITDPDYCHVRVGLGSQRLATRLISPETGPVEDLEPVASVSLRRFVRSHSVVEDLPTAVSLRGFASIALEGQRDAARSLVRAMLMQLCTFHGPDILQIAVVRGPDTQVEWEWVKWLPHTQHPEAYDGAGAARMVYGSYLELEGALGEQLSMRGRFSRNAPASSGVPHVVVVVDGGLLEGDSGLLTGAGLDSVTILDLCGFSSSLSASRGLRLVVAPDQVGAVSSAGVEKFARPDSVSTTTAQTFGRRMAPYRAASQNAVDSGDDDTASRSWSQMLGIGNAARFNPEHAWLPRQGRDRLRVPIGVGADGQPVELDLKESAENGMGPHGLCIGATGSGKSEFLRTLVLGLIATHSPNALNLVLVDFKGGATFLGLEEAPHVAAVITNLAEELAMVDRMRDALAGEMNRRQELLRAAGNFANVSDYEKARMAGAALDPLPALFVVVDEFSELLSQQPEFADLFVAIGRLGRSLHIHLLLASQRLDEGKLRGLDSHLSYRIGLKTFSANESRTVLGVPDAYYLPGNPGAGYVKADSAEIVRFQGAYVSGHYEGARIAPTRLATEQSVGLAPVLFTAATVISDHLPEDVVEPDFVDMGEAGDESRTLMGVLVDRIKEYGPRAHEVWLPPLSESPTLDQLLPRAVSRDPNLPRGNLSAAFGIVDRPFDQRRDPLVVDLNGSTGNVAIVGGPQSGKSTALRTLIMAFALTHTAEQVQFYCLDFGGGTLLGLRDLPHVGSVANRLDQDRVRRTVAEVSTVVQQRERLFRELGIDSMVEFRRLRTADPRGVGVAAGLERDRFGDVFLVIDGWPSVRSDFESLEGPISILAAQGLSFGVHVMVTAPRWADIRPALKDQLGTRIELRLGDPGDSDAGRQKANLVPERHAGRGITREGLHLLTGLPRMDGISSSVELSAAVSDSVMRIAAMSTSRPAPPVRMLPESYTRAELLASVGDRWPQASAGDGRCLRVPVGLGETDLEPVYMDFAEHPHLLIFGDTACGKTSLLRGIAEGIMASNTPAQAKLIIGDYRHSMLGVVDGNHLGGYSASAATFGELMADLARIVGGRMPNSDTTQQQLRERSWWSGPEIYVIIDDYDLVATSTGNPVAALLEFIPHSKDVGLHLVIARRSGGAGRALFEPVIARIRDMAPAGVVMSGSRDEGNLVGAVRGSEMPQGRGTYVSRSQTQLVQLPWMPPL